MDPFLTEAILRTLRMLTFITGSLVLIDSIGILVRPTEHPPHKPKWAAISWCMIAATAALVSGYLLAIQAGLVENGDPLHQQAAIWVFYGGLTAGFTSRAISRAHRPFYTILAVIGLSIAGIIFALKDIAG